MLIWSTSHAKPQRMCLKEEDGKVEQASILSLQQINHCASGQHYDFGCFVVSPRYWNLG